ncbi:His-Xaa-Ser system protein HxsD [Acidihalobacter prosperus]|uniref:His-Xaa-Ser system protein HxsD n=1 Tax=Acidihalobacter prosperus TaxID=160660 RepID=UPI0005054A96
MQNLALDCTCYSIDAVQKAAYRFIDRLTIQISTSDSEIICSIEPIKKNSDLDVLIADFKRELLDQELREKIKVETAPVRDLILSLAFSKSGLQE